MGKRIEGLELSAVHSAGKAVGTHEGKNIFVPFGIPGDVVDVELDRRQRGFYSAAIQQIVRPAPSRIEPFCKHHGVCGGCNWQHIDYEYQLILKRQILENALRKYNIYTPEIPSVIPSPRNVHFRNKVEYAFAAEGFTSAESVNTSGPCLGYHPIDGRSKVINIEECWLQQQPSRRICETAAKTAIEQNLSFYNYETRSGFLRNLIIRTSTRDETLVVIGTTEDKKELILPYLEALRKSLPEIASLLYTVLSSPEKGFMDGAVHLFHGPGFLSEKMGDFNFRVSPKAFFQPNPYQATHIYNKVLEFAAPSGHELVYDLYTGAGTIASYLAPHVGKAIGIEGSAEAIDDANNNVVLNHLTNTEFITGDVLETFKPEFVTQHGKPDIIVLDPPRSGTLIEIKKTIVGSAPDKIIYVSCNPVSLAFDLTMLTNGYKVTQIQPYDMFPHTHHTETVVLLEKE